MGICQSFFSGGEKHEHPGEHPGHEVDDHHAGEHLDQVEIVGLLGHGGATIKKIERDSGARIQIDRKRGSVSYEGTETQVNNAKALVAAAALKAHEAPDYCGEDGGKKRAKALRVQKRSREAKRQAHELWEKGDKAGAKTMSERGKELDAQAKKLHDQAAHAIYLHRNGGRPDNYIDLHGLFVEEALRFLKERLKTFAPGEKLEVVTGAGHHSEDHQAKIKPAVIEYLGKKKLRWEELNAGDLLVYT